MRKGEDIPQFGDENTLDDIHGVILVAEGYPEAWQDLDINRQLTEIVDRIREKLSRNKNRIRKNWFTTALEYAELAREYYKQNDFEKGRTLLRQVEEYLLAGNRAHKCTKPTFIVAASGVTTPTKEVMTK